MGLARVRVRKLSRER